MPSCAAVAENLDSCHHMSACRYSTCCFMGQEQVTTRLLLRCTTQLSPAGKWGHKGMWRLYAEDLGNTLIYSSNAGLHPST